MKRERQYCNFILQNLANTKALTTMQWQLVTCLLRKVASCDLLALYKSTTIYVVDIKGGLFLLKGRHMARIGQINGPHLGQGGSKVFLHVINMRNFAI